MKITKKKFLIAISPLAVFLLIWTSIPFFTIETSYRFYSMCSCGGDVFLKDGKIIVDDWHFAPKGDVVGTYKKISGNKYVFNFKYDFPGQELDFKTEGTFDHRGFLDDNGGMKKAGLDNRYIALHNSGYLWLSALFGWRPWN